MREVKYRVLAQMGYLKKMDNFGIYMLVGR